MSKVYEFNVAMTCGGCSGAVERVLGKLKVFEKSSVAYGLVALGVQPDEKCLADGRYFAAGQGVDEVDISLEDQLVRVKSTLAPEELLEVIKKTGKATTYLGVKN